MNAMQELREALEEYEFRGTDGAAGRLAEAASALLQAPPAMSKSTAKRIAALQAPPAAAALWTDEQCREFCRVAFRHRHQPGLPTQTTLDDIRYGAHFAMLAAALAANKENTND